mmetsp:Transcript_41176/g.30280  ORF Transcript_41176/g.30280 Transcript_41176/m.30280 type:complete len:99 (-) Transcript_41176:203-499(-)
MMSIISGFNLVEYWRGNSNVFLTDADSATRTSIKAGATSQTGNNRSTIKYLNFTTFPALSVSVSQSSIKLMNTQVFMKNKFANNARQWFARVALPFGI